MKVWQPWLEMGRSIEASGHPRGSREALTFGALRQRVLQIGLVESSVIATHLDASTATWVGRELLASSCSNLVLGSSRPRFSPSTQI
jgi:hypothetical protein